MITRRTKFLKWKMEDLYRWYPRSFWVLIGGTFIDRLGTNLIMPFLAVYVARQFNATMTQIGVIFTIFAITGVGGSVLGGAMADKFGRRTVLIIGLVFGSLARVGLGLAADMNTLYVIAAFAGFFGAVGWPAQAAMTADLLGEDKRANGFGMQRVVNNITWVLGPLIGGLLAPLTGYLLLFVLDAVTSFIMAMMVFAMLPETRPTQHKDQPVESFGRNLAGYGHVMRDGTFMAFTLISILMMIAYLQMYSTLSVFLVRFQHMPESFYGAMLMINASIVVFFQFAITRWAARRAPMRIMMLGAALYLIGLTSYGLVVVPVLYTLAMVFITIGESLAMPTGQALVAQLAPADMRGRYVAVSGFTWIIPQALGPLAAGVVMDNLNPNWVWYACGLLCAISIAGFYALHLRVGQRLGGVPEEQPVRVTAPGEPAPAS